MYFFFHIGEFKKLDKERIELPYAFNFISIEDISRAPMNRAIDCIGVVHDITDIYQLSKGNNRKCIFFNEVTLNKNMFE